MPTKSEIRARAEARAHRAAQLRAQGRTYPAIAAELGVSVGQAHTDVHRIFAEQAQDAAQHVAEQVAIIDQLRHETMCDTELPTDRKVAAIVKLLEREARLLGLDRPAQAQVVAVHVTDMIDQTRGLAEQLGPETLAVIDAHLIHLTDTEP